MDLFIYFFANYSYKELTNVKSPIDFREGVGFPCLVRSSYVLIGAAMSVAHTPQNLETFFKKACAISKQHPVVVLKFILAAKVKVERIKSSIKFNASHLITKLLNSLLCVYSFSIFFHLHRITS